MIRTMTMGNIAMTPSEILIEPFTDFAFMRRALAAASDDLQRLVLVLLRSSKRRRKALARIWKEPA